MSYSDLMSYTTPTCFSPFFRSTTVPTLVENLQFLMHLYSITVWLLNEFESLLVMNKIINCFRECYNKHYSTYTDIIQTQVGSVVVDIVHNADQLCCSKHSYQLSIYVRCNNLPDNQHTHQFQVFHCTRMHQHFLNNHILENKQYNHCIVRLFMGPRNSRYLLLRILIFYPTIKQYNSVVLFLLRGAQGVPPPWQTLTSQTIWYNTKNWHSIWECTRSNPKSKKFPRATHFILRQAPENAPLRWSKIQ